LTSALTLLWRDLWGKETVDADDVDRRFGQVLDAYDKLDKKSEETAAELVRVEESILARVQESQQEGAERTMRYLVENLRWKRSKAAAGAKAVARALGEQARKVS